MPDTGRPSSPKLGTALWFTVLLLASVHRFANYGEYVADTIPTNALSYFRIQSIAPAPGPRLSYASSTSRVYTLYCRTHLTSGAWSNIPSQTAIPGSGGVDTLTDPTPADTQRFYRLGVSLP